MAKVKEVKTLAVNMGKGNKIEQDKGERSIWDKISFIPIVVILGIVPLIIRLKVLHATGIDKSYALGSRFADPFSYWKANLVLIMAVTMVIMGFFFFMKKDVKISKYIKIGVIALGIFALATIVSAIVSPHQSLVWWGQYGQRQGLITIISYVLITLYSLHFYKRKEDIKYILVPLGIMATVETIIILSQFVGKDIIFSDFVKSIIIPSEYSSFKDTMENTVEGKAYGTLFNPNYVGSFTSLLLPVFVFSAIKAEKIGHRIILGVMAVVIIVSLFASGSRAGILGISVSVIFAALLLGKNLLKNPKMLAIGLIIVVVAGFGFNIVSGGLVFERISSIGKDALSVFASDGGDILDNSVIKDMYIKDNKFTIDMAEGKQINLSINSDDEVVLTDQGGSVIDYVMEDVYLVVKTALPINIRFQKGTVEDNNGLGYLYVVEIDEKQWFMLIVEDGQLISLDKYGNPIDIKIAESIGFSGKEQIGSNRGYIWSRALPIMRDNLLLGVGPDSLVAEFPHGDIVVRNAVYGYAGAVVDKPHNLYLQIGINQGIIALAAFLVLNITYIVNSFKVYFKKKEYSFHDMFGIGIFLGIIGYLGAGMFNDSVVSVAPLYWCLLGVGYAVNYVNEKKYI